MKNAEKIMWKVVGYATIILIITIFAYVITHPNT